MPGYIKEVLQKYKHSPPQRPQFSPFAALPRKYGKAAQEPMAEDTSPPASDAEKKRMQQVVSSILYCARAVNLTALMALSSLAMQQARATGETIDGVSQLLDYLAMNSDATVRFVPSDMV